MMIHNYLYGDRISRQKYLKAAPFFTALSRDGNRLFATLLIFLLPRRNAAFHRNGIHCYGGPERFVLQERR